MDGQKAMVISSRGYYSASRTYLHRRFYYLIERLLLSTFLRENVSSPCLASLGILDGRIFC
jgi:hypothetical protein